MSVNIENSINKILWGGRYIMPSDSRGEKHLVVIKALNAKDIQFVNFIYNDAMKEAKDSGLLNKFEIYKEYKSRGIWTQEQDITIESTKKKIDELKGKIEDAPNKRFAAQLKKRVEDLQRELNKVLKERREMYAASAESYAEEKKNYAVVFCVSHDEHENRLWSSWSEFLATADDDFIVNILRELSQNKFFTTKEIRAIARHPSWRFRWNCAKQTGDLFDRPIKDLDSDQQALVYWSQVYDSVFEHYERPSDEIIEDDEALDKWLENKNKERKAKDVEKGGSIGKMKLSSKIRSHGEIFVVANKAINPDAPSIEEVEGLNTEIVKKFKKAEAQRLKKAGEMSEKDLRNRQNKMARKMIGSRDAVLSGRKGMGSQKKVSNKRYMDGGTL